MPKITVKLSKETDDLLGRLCVDLGLTLPEAIERAIHLLESRPKPRRYVARKDGEWFDVDPQHKIKCCDCGLIHRCFFRVHDGRIQMRAVRDNRATAQVRRHKK